MCALVLPYAARVRGVERPVPHAAKAAGARRRRLRCQASPSVCWSIIWIITAQKRDAYGLGCLVFAPNSSNLRAHNRTGQTTAHGPRSHAKHLRTPAPRWPGFWRGPHIRALITVIAATWAMEIRS